jgi:hypothetical protein
MPKRRAAVERVARRTDAAVGALRAAQTKLDDAPAVGRNAETRRVGRHQRRKVDEHEQRRFEELADGERTLDAHERNFAEHNGALVDGVDAHLRRVERREPGEERVLGVRQLGADKVNLGGREFEARNKAQSLFEAGEDRRAAFERRRAKEQIKHGVVLVRAVAPVGVRHRDLILVREQRSHQRIERSES